MISHRFLLAIHACSFDDAIPINTWLVGLLTRREGAEARRGVEEEVHKEIVLVLEVVAVLVKVRHALRSENLDDIQ